MPVSFEFVANAADFLQIAVQWGDKTQRLQPTPLPEQVLDHARRIREDFITGSSCTVILCDAETLQWSPCWRAKALADKPLR